MSRQSELDRWCVAFLDGDMSAGQFKRAITDWHQQEIAKARVDTLEYAKIAPKFKIEEKIEQLEAEL